MTSFLVVGCPQGDNPKSVATAAQVTTREGDRVRSPDRRDVELPESGAAKSPAAAFKRMKKAVNSGDHTTLYTMLSGERQGHFVSRIIVRNAVALSPIGAKADAEKKQKLDMILSKHGLAEHPASNPRNIFGPNGYTDMLDQMRKRLDAVKDRQRLSKALIRFLNANGLHEEHHEVLSFEALEARDAKAPAIVVMKTQTGHTIWKKVELHEVDGRWYFHVLDWTD